MSQGGGTPLGHPWDTFLFFAPKTKIRVKKLNYGSKKEKLRVKKDKFSAHIFFHARFFVDVFFRGRFFCGRFFCATFFRGRFFFVDVFFRGRVFTEVVRGFSSITLLT